MATTRLGAVTHHLDTSVDEHVELVATGPTEMHSFEAHNKNSADMWLHIFDAAAAVDVTIPTTAPVQSYLIPAGDGTLYGANSRDLVSPLGLFAGFCYAVTDDPDGGSGPSTDCIVNFTYRAVHG